MSVSLVKPTRPFTVVGAFDDDGVFAVAVILPGAHTPVRGTGYAVTVQASSPWRAEQTGTAQAERDWAEDLDTYLDWQARWLAAAS